MMLKFRPFFSLLTVITIYTSCINIEEGQSPNIVFLFADDMTYTAIRALGNEEIHTPNLDRLVHGGVTFTNTFNMGGWNGAVCAASRAMIISGRSIWRANEFRKNWGKADTVFCKQSWGRLMEQAGYDTYMTGKWHVDAPAGKIFQEVTHIRPGMPKDSWPKNNTGRRLKEEVGQVGADGKIIRVEDVMPIGYNRPLSEEDESWSPSDPKFGGFWEGGKHWSEVLKDDALEFINLAKEKDNPFFMYLAFNAPHDPRQAPQEYIDKYPIDKISIPKSFLPEYPWKDDIGNWQGLRDEALAVFPRTEFAIKKHTQEYYAIITHLDTQIGIILDALEASGKMDNTYIFFTADHGLAMGRHGLLGKQTMYDHSIRPPLMFAGPGIPKGKKVDSDIYLQDVMATSLELAGIVKPDYVEFNSFLDQAKTENTESSYSQIYGAYIDLQRMIRKDGYKLIVYPTIKKVLLFDLINDPEEIHNIAELEKHQLKVETLFDDLVQLQNQMGDTLNLRNIFNETD